MGGTVFVFGYNAVSAVLRGMGDSRHPLIFVLISTVANIILDIIFVGPLDMGAAGAAWATIIAQALSFVLAVAFLRRNNFIFDFRPRSFRIDKNIALQLLKIGLPTSIQGTLVSFSFMWLTRLANDIAGIVGQTSISIAGKVNSVAILPAFAMQASVSSMAGQNLGAGKPERAKKTMFVGMGLAFAFSSVVFILVNALSEQVVTLFIGSGNTELPAEVVARCISEGSRYIRCISYDYLIASLHFCINGLAISAGRPCSPFSTPRRAPFCSVCRRHGYSVSGGWDFRASAAAPIAGLGSLTIGIIYLISGRWRVSSIKDIRAVTN